MSEVLMRRVIGEILIRVTRECNKACKTGEYFNTKNYSCEICLIGRLVLRCEDEIVNRTEISVDDKKVTRK